MRFLVEQHPVPPADPLAWWAASRDADRFLWSRDGVTVAASGALHAIEVGGADRFAAAERGAAALCAAVVDPPAGEPLLVGGFAFDATPARDAAWPGFPALRFWLPGRLLVRRGEASTLYAIAPQPPRIDDAVVRAVLRERLAVESARLPQEQRLPSCGTSPAYRVAADRTHTGFRDLVAAARDAVKGGAFEKLVVARSVRVESSAPIEPAALLDALRRTHPSCTTFAVARGASCFLGASPERLLALDGRRISTMALAGSAPRGRTPEEDAQLGAALRESKKEQEEHAVVVRAIGAALGPHCESLAVPESPRLLRIEGIQHLESRIEGMLRAPSSALALAARLHPTPAVAGAPREDAVAWIRTHEALARGWYAGGVGWLDAGGGGELAVALRCARIERAAAVLYAGAGVVAASDPHAELVETRLKLRALLAPLLEL